MPVLDPYSVSKRARRHGYREVSSSSPYVLTFVHHRKLGCGGWKNKYGKVTVDVNCDAGEVVTQLNHHKFGKTQLARDVFSLNLLDKILRNPRVHTNTGRHVGHQQFGDDEDFGYRSGYYSGDCYSPRNEYFSDDGYSPRSDYYSDDGYYPRNNYYSDDGYRSRKSQSRDRRSRSRDRSNKSEVRSYKSGDRSNKSEVRSSKSGDSRSRSRDRRCKSEVRRSKTGDRRGRSGERSGDSSGRSRRDRSRERSQVRRWGIRSRDRSPQPRARKRSRRG